MKKRYLQLGVVILALLFTACSDDFTEVTPQGSATGTNFWTTVDDAQDAVNAMYYPLADEEMFGRGFMWYINASDDMVTGRVKADADNIKNFKVTGDEGYAGNLFSQLYVIIGEANKIIANVPDMDITDSQKQQFTGEAYFMRGFSYFWLASCYGNDVSGGVPIVTEENMDETRFTRPASVVDNYSQIVSDLTIAAQRLPLVTEYNSDNLGRANKDACYAYMAKTCLYWAQYDDSQWQNVITYCDDVTNSGSGRALINTGDPSSDFKSVFKYQNDFSTEYIWSVTSGVSRGSKLPGVMLENKGWGVYNGWGYYMPTAELYEAFEDGDYRRSATILNFGDEFKFFGESRRYYSTNSASGFQFNKYMDIFSYDDPIGSGLLNANGNALYSVEDVPLLRYAEVLLMKAEAEIMLNRSGDAEINAVRERAGLAGKTNCTLADLKHERRVELAGEFSNRHRDLVRWGDAGAVYAQPLHGYIHTDKTNPDSPYSRDIIWQKRTYDPAVNNVWPIPNTDVASSGIEQNKGYE